MAAGPRGGDRGPLGGDVVRPETCGFVCNGMSSPLAPESGERALIRAAFSGCDFSVRSWTGDLGLIGVEGCDNAVVSCTRRDRGDAEFSLGGTARVRAG